MKTIANKNLPVMRVLLHNVNSDETKSIHALSKDAKHKLAMRLIEEKQNVNFEFYEITDGKNLLVEFAVLKTNRDSIVPYRYYDDDDEKYITLVEFTSDGLMGYEPIQEHQQHEFVYWMNVWLYLLNQLFEIV